MELTELLAPILEEIDCRGLIIVAWRSNGGRRDPVDVAPAIGEQLCDSRVRTLPIEVNGLMRPGTEPLPAAWENLPTMRRCGLVKAGPRWSHCRGWSRSSPQVEEEIMGHPAFKLFGGAEEASSPVQPVASSILQTPVSAPATRPEPQSSAARRMSD